MCRSTTFRWSVETTSAVPRAELLEGGVSAGLWLLGARVPLRVDVWLPRAVVSRPLIGVKVTEPSTFS